MGATGQRSIIRGPLKSLQKQTPERSSLSVRKIFRRVSDLALRERRGVGRISKICGRVAAAECSERLTFDLHFLDGVFQRHPFKLGYYYLEE